MTRTARAMGMTRTIFRNASGLPRPANVTTARDLATLALRIQRDFPRLYKRYFGLRYFRYGRRIFRNHNHLLGRVRGMDGLKTGYTRAAGFNLAASTMRDGKRIVTVVLGGRTGRARNAYMARLIEQMFRTRRLKKGVRIAALAGMPPGLTREMAQRINASGNKRVAARKPAPSRPAPAMARPRPRPAAVAKAAPEKDIVRPVSRPLEIAALARKSAEAARPAARPAAKPAKTAKAVTDNRETPSAPRSRPAGTVFAQVRPVPAPSPAPAADEASASSAAPGKAQALYASVSVRPQETGAASDAGKDAPLHTAATQPARETVIAKTDETLTAGALALPPGRAPGERIAVTTVRERESALKDEKPAAGEDAGKTRKDAALASYLKTWNIQLGAFPALDGARARLNAVRKRFRPYVRGKAAFTMTFTKGKTTFYRARFAGFSRATARRTCRILKRKGIPCFALAPDNS